MNKRQFLKTLGKGALAWMALPALPGALELLAAGQRSTLHEANRHAAHGKVNAERSGARCIKNPRGNDPRGI